MAPRWRPASPRVRPGATLAVAGALLFLAVPLPWYSVEAPRVSLSVTGLDSVVMASFAVVLGAVQVLVGLATMYTGQRGYSVVSLFAATMSTGFAGLAIVFAVSVAGAIPSIKGIDVGGAVAGVGLWLVLLSGLLGVVASSIVLLASDPSAPAYRATGDSGW